MTDRVGLGFSVEGFRALGLLGFLGAQVGLDVTANKPQEPL